MVMNHLEWDSQLVCSFCLPTFDVVVNREQILLFVDLPNAAVKWFAAR